MGQLLAFLWGQRMPRTGTRGLTVRGAPAIEEGVGIPPNYKLSLANTQLEEEQGTETLPPRSEGISIQEENPGN